jgi:type II secretory pathway pseudopilin PulG
MKPSLINPSSRLSSRRFRRSVGRAAFTLLEMAIVLGIIMILALVVFSTTLRQLDRVAADKEIATLSRCAEALQQSIQRWGIIPAATNWATVVAAELGVEVAAVTANSRQRARILLVDPTLQIGGNGGGLPYTNRVFGSTNMVNSYVCPPINPRLMLITSLGPTPLPEALTNGSYTSATFSNLWNWSGSENTLPAGWNWSGSGLDLQVQRLNLSSLFVHLVLMNYPPASTTNRMGRYSLGSSWAYVSNPPVDAYFIKNTLIGLINTNGSVDAQLLTRDTSFLYGFDGVWRVTPKGTDLPTDTMRGTVEQMMTQFRASKGNANAGLVNNVRATPTSCADAMTTFMNAYVPWADDGFRRTGTLYTDALAAYNAVTAQMDALADNLTPNGCN